MSDNKPTGAMAGGRLAVPVKTSSIKYGSAKAASYSAAGSFGNQGAPNSEGVSEKYRASKNVAGK